MATKMGDIMLSVLGGLAGAASPGLARGITGAADLYNQRLEQKRREATQAAAAARQDMLDQRWEEQQVAAAEQAALDRKDKDRMMKLREDAEKRLAEQFGMSREELAFKRKQFEAKLAADQRDREASQAAVAQMMQTLPQGSQTEVLRAIAPALQPAQLVGPAMKIAQPAEGRPDVPLSEIFRLGQGLGPGESISAPLPGGGTYRRSVKSEPAPMSQFKIGDELTRAMHYRSQAEEALSTFMMITKKNPSEQQQRTILAYQQQIEAADRQIKRLLEAEKGDKKPADEMTDEEIGAAFADSFLGGS